jgi:hypothetical protein
MIDAHKLKADDNIVYLDNKIPDRYYHELVIGYGQQLKLMPLPLTPNKTYKVIKTNYISSTSIGVTIKADDGNIKEINLYNELGLPRFKRLEDSRDEKLRKLLGL